MSPALEVLAAGPLTTVQDAGRRGALRYGVPRGGAMDGFALCAANRLVGNPPGAAALEITMGAVTLRALRPLLVALAGADLRATSDGQPLPLWTAALLREGAQIVLPGRTGAWGGRAYLSLAGGLDVPLVLGARATHLPSAFGGLEGRRLRAGDQLDAGAASSDPLRIAGRVWPEEARPRYSPAPLLRFVPGPHQQHFAPGALDILAAATLRVSRDSNRMGYRLEGVRLPFAGRPSLASLGVIPGAIQAPPDGAPILLMADAQPTGGYPLAGVVIAADMPLAAQLLPGDTLRLMPVTLDEALAARRVYEQWCDSTLDEAEDMALPGQTGMPG